MRIFGSRIITFAAFVAIWFATAVSSGAQLRIELGNSGANVKRSMISKGYTEVAIIKQSLGATTAEGCLDGVRYRIKVLFTGQTKWRQEVGKCRSQISVEQAKQILVQQGYDRIDMEARRNKYLAIACLNGERLRVSVDLFGEVRQQRRLGRCRPSRLSPTDVRAELRRQGYTRIKFIDRQLPRYVAEACRGLTRVELTISGTGDIRRENDIGDCRRAIDPRNLVKIMKKAGFDRVKVIDDQLPQYVVEACRKGRKSEITLNRFGRITDQFNLGKCGPRYNRNQLLKLVKSQKLTRAEIISQNNGVYVVNLCDGAVRKQVTYNVYGEVTGERTRGSCASNSVLDVYKSFSKRKVAGVKFYAEGCQNGKKVRIEFSNIGDPIGRKNLGAC